MTLNNFLEAVAEKLVGLWPDRHVFVNEIPKDSDGNFFVGIIEATQEKKLDRRRRRHVQIEVLYFLASKDNLDFNEWSEKMLDEFESLTVVETESRSRLVRLTNVTARKDDDSRVYQFLFDADFYRDRRRGREILLHSRRSHARPFERNNVLEIKGGVIWDFLKL